MAALGGQAEGAKPGSLGRETSGFPAGAGAEPRAAVPARTGPGARGPEGLLQGVARLLLGGAFGSSFRAAIAPFSGFARRPLWPREVQRSPGPESGAEAWNGRGRQAEQGRRRKRRATGEPSVQDGFAAGELPVRWHRTSQEKVRACLAWAAPAPGQEEEGTSGRDPAGPPAFRSLGARKSEASPRFGSNFQAAQNFVLRERSRLGSNGAPRLGKMDPGARRCFSPAQQREEAKRRPQTKESVPANCRKWGLQRTPEVRVSLPARFKPPTELRLTTGGNCAVGQGSRPAAPGSFPLPVGKPGSVRAGHRLHQPPPSPGALSHRGKRALLLLLLRAR